MFPKELTRRICLQLQASLNDADHFLFSHDLHLRFRGDTEEKLDANQSLGSKGSIG